jgi:GNAT superfamily N-acetyltransferase
LARKQITVRPVGPDDWPAFEALFEAPGAPKNCWCMAWRGTSEERRAFTEAQGEKASSGRARSSELRRAAIKSRIEQGVPVGLLAYVNGEPIAWCSIAPRPSYRNLGGPKDFADRPDTVWSLACFFVAKPWRGHGLTGQLIDAALAYAEQNGADLVEAYPTRPDSPSYRFMGTTPAFEVAGFAAVGTAGSRRVVMRRHVGARALET